MAKESYDERHICIYKSIERGCAACKSSHACPPLVVIAMRYAREMAAR